MPLATENETLEQKLNRLEAENAALKNKATAKISLKVSEKGAVSLYGLGRFPITLYAEQWAAVIENIERIKQFIADHKFELSHKN